MGDGFSPMFLNERLVFGLAPTNLEDALVQRLRALRGSARLIDPVHALPRGHVRAEGAPQLHLL